jgi:tRNA threonylcarbamoyl adenosine modification protein YeaZ
MRLILAIETSSADFGVAVAADGRVVASETVRRTAPEFESLDALVRTVLDRAGAVPADVERIAVDRGPADMLSVRSGVAYANGLAFSLGRPVAGVDCLELLAHEARKAAQPVLAVRRAAGGNVFAALFRDGVRLDMRYGPPALTLPALVGDEPEVTVVGELRPAVLDLLAGRVAHDGGVTVPTVAGLAELVIATSDERTWGEVASPLTENSTVFSG